MKKRVLTFLISICFLILCVFSFVGCGGNTPPDNPPPHTHSWSSEYYFDSQYHYYTCSGCDEVKDKQEHDFETIGNATCAICYFCLDHQHFEGSEYAYDAEGHWSKCGYCQDEMPETKSIHEYIEDKCVICGYVNPNYVPTTLPVVSKMHDLRVIAKEFYTLIIFPDGKIALIDPYIYNDEVLSDLMLNALPQTHDEDHDGLIEIDYLIFTNTTYIPTSTWWDFVEVVNLYRPNIGINVEEVMFNSSFDNRYYNGQAFTQEEMLNMPKYLTTGVNVPYYDSVVEVETPKPYFGITQEGRYDISVLYLAALYYADLNGVNVIPIKPENSITHTFSYMGNEYTYSLDFLDLGVEFNVNDSYFKEMVIHGYTSNEDVYLISGTKTFDQYAEYDSMFTVSYKDFKMLYMCEVSRRSIETFIEKYSPMNVDLFVLSYAHAFEAGATNTSLFLVDIYEQFTDAVFNESTFKDNVMFVNPYHWGKYTSHNLNIYFLKDDSGYDPVVTWDNFIRTKLLESSSDKSNIRTACYRVNRFGQQSVEKWVYGSQEQFSVFWDDWK